jgi:hypothetical protein
MMKGRAFDAPGTALFRWELNERGGSIEYPTNHFPEAQQLILAITAQPVTKITRKDRKKLSISRTTEIATLTTVKSLSNNSNNSSTTAKASVVPAPK